MSTRTVAAYAGLAIVLATPSALRPRPLAAQDRSPGLKSDWTFSVGAVVESNPFRLSDGEQAGFDASAPRHLDMQSVSDVGSLLGIEADFRTRRTNGRRSRFGFEVEAEVYGRNSARTSLALDAFYAFEFSKRDEIKIEAAIDPGEFRKTYLVGYDAAGTAEFAAGEISRRTIGLGYSRELVDGRSIGVDLTLEAQRRWRAVKDMPWRDRVETGGEAAFEMKLGKRLDLDLSVDWRMAEHEATPEPFGGQMVTLTRDFDAWTYGATLGLDVSRSLKTFVDYELRDRAFAAAAGEDPRYGGRVDRRQDLGLRMRVEASRTVDVWLGGEFRFQDSMRPAFGSDVFEADYRQGTAFLRVEYSR